MIPFTNASLPFWQIAILGEARAAREQEQGLAGTPSILDQEYARIAERAPGFGGVYLDQQGTLHVYLQDLSYAHEVQGLSDRVEVRQGDHSFRDLLAWKSEARLLLARPGLLALDIDEARNRLVIVAEPASADRLRRELPELLRPTSVPAAAVLVDEGQPLELWHCRRDEFRFAEPAGLAAAA